MTATSPSPLEKSAIEALEDTKQLTKKRKIVGAATTERDNQSGVTPTDGKPPQKV